MENYFWDEDKLHVEYLNIKKKLKKHDLTKEQKDVLEYNLALLEETRKHTCNGFIRKLPNFITCIKNKIEFDVEDAREAIKFYVSPFQHEFIKSMYEEFLNKNFKDIDYNILKREMSLDDKILLCKQCFVQSYGNSDDINKIFNPKNHLLYLKKDDKKSNFIPYGDSGLIIVPNKNDIESFCKLSHEIGHYFEFCFNDEYYSYKTEKNILYEEVSSILFELIAIDKLKENNFINEEEQISLHNDILDIYFCGNEYLNLKLITSQPNPNIKDKIAVKAYYDTITDTAYFYSYLIAIDLYYQYLDNKKIAIENLKHLLLDFDYKKELQLLEECQIDLSGNVLRKHLNKLKK